MDTFTNDDCCKVGNQYFYFDYHDGSYGYNTSSSRGADTFFPFNQGTTFLNDSTRLNLSTLALDNIISNQWYASRSVNWMFNSKPFTKVYTRKMYMGGYDPSGYYTLYSFINGSIIVLASSSQGQSGNSITTDISNYEYLIFTGQYPGSGAVTMEILFN